MKDNRISKNTCGCCEGVEVLTPAVTANRPGLNALAYRIGTHATFLETMKARLSYHSLDAAEEQTGSDGKGIVQPLKLLRTRDASDPAIALLDAWATVADVLTFYQERIANEGFLRTATERRSVLELARLIGYKLRPGVASSVYLAYTLEEDRSVTPPKPTAVTIPAGSRAQSVPGPGELPQTFETEENLDARSIWNNLQVRLTQPQTKESILEGSILLKGPRIYLKGVATNLKENDPLLIDFGDRKPELYRVVEVTPDAAADRTLVILQLWQTVVPSNPVSEVRIILKNSRNSIAGLPASLQAKLKTPLDDLEFTLTTTALREKLVAFVKEKTVPTLIRVVTEDPNSTPQAQLVVAEMVKSFVSFIRGDVILDAVTGPPVSDRKAPLETLDMAVLVKSLRKQPSSPPANSLRLDRTVGKSFSAQADTRLGLISSFAPELQQSLPQALANANLGKPSEVQVYALRLKTTLFGSSAPREPQYEPPAIFRDGRAIKNPQAGQLKPQSTWPEWDLAADEKPDSLFLSSSFNQILAGSWVAILKPNAPAQFFDGIDVRNVSRNAYGVTSETTLLNLKTKTWWKPDIVPPVDLGFDGFEVIRGTTVFAQSQKLELAEEPIEKDICPDDQSIELDGLYNGLLGGRWFIVAGERTDIAGISGVKVGELVMLDRINNDTTTLPGDKIHTFIGLAKKISYCYKRDTVKIYGNVVAATNGETRNEVLGSGDGSKALQTFVLKQPPLTYVSASTPSGVESTLKVRINDVLWHEADSLADLNQNDRRFITRTDNDANTSVIFGNGERGSRLPTGVENVKAVYRNGIGKPGNVKAEQISLLTSRPLGVKEVINPLRASGGADSDSRDAARRNAPLTVTALDRLVSVQDYEDFAHTFAGIGKANATRLSNGRGQLVFLTIAGTDDIPIDEGSDLYKNLFRALHQFGDPNQSIQITIRTLMLLVISAGVRLNPDYLWESVEPKIRAALLDKFSFERRELGQDVFLSEAIATIQKIEGVTYVDVDLLDGIPEALAEDPEKLSVKLQSLATTGFPEQPLARILVDMPAPGNPQPAQLAYLTPNIPDTLILKELPS